MPAGAPGQDAGGGLGPVSPVQQRDQGFFGDHQAADRLLATGEATITTSRGTVLARPGPSLAGSLSTESVGDNGVSGTGGTRLHEGTEAGLRGEVRRPLIWAIIDLVGG